MSKFRQALLHTKVVHQLACLARDIATVYGKNPSYGLRPFRELRCIETVTRSACEIEKKN